MSSSTSTGHLIVRNSLFLYLARAVELGSSLLFIGLIARYLGKEGFGEYARISAAVNLLAMVINFGLTIILIREISRRQFSSDRLVGSVSILRLLLILLILAAVSIYLLFSHENDQIKKAILYYAVGQAVFVQATVYHGLFVAFQRAEYQAIVFSVEKIVLIGALILVIRSDLGFLAVIGVILLARVLNCSLAYFFATTRFVRPSYAIDPSLLRVLASESAPLGLSLFLKHSKGKTGTLTVATLVGTIQAGLFEGALRFVDILFLLPKVLTEALFPTLSATLVTSPDTFAAAYRRLVQLFMIVSVFLALLVGLLADQLVVMILGPDFGETTAILRVMAGAIVFIFLNVLFSSILSAMGKQRLETFSLCSALIIALGLMLALVPHYGAVGAGIAYVVGEAVLFSLNYWFISQNLRTVNFGRAIVRPLLGGVAATVILTFLRAQGVHVVPLLGLGSAIYGLALVLLGSLSKDEVVFIRNALQGISS